MRHAKTLYSPVGNSRKIDFGFWNLQITQDSLKITRNHTQKSSLIRDMVKFSKFTFQKNKHIRVLSWSILSIIYHQTYVTNISSSSSRSLRLRHFFEMFEISRPEIDTSLRSTSSLSLSIERISVWVSSNERRAREKNILRWFCSTFDDFSTNCHFRTFETRDWHISSKYIVPLLINRKNINISILKREESEREEHLAMILFEFRWFFDKLSFSNFRDQRLTHLF